MAVWLIATAMLFGSCGGDDDRSALTVPALWYGQRADGDWTGGVVDVTVETSTSGSVGLVVDVAGSAASGAGPAWTASGRTAAAVAVLLWGRVPTSVEIGMRVSDEIDGPSAGALMTSAFLADLSGGHVRPAVAVTGTILPNGAVGVVGGVPEKLRAAAASGITTVVVPAAQRRAVDPRTGDEVDVAELGAALGVEVVFVSTVDDAAAVLAGRQFTPVGDAWSSATAARASGFDHYLSDRASNTVETLGRLRPRTPATSDDVLVRSHERVVTMVHDAPAAVMADLEGNEPLAAYARALLTERAVEIWEARVAAYDAVSVEGVDPVAIRLFDEAQGIEALALAARDRIAETVPGTVEETVALVDAATWATDAALSARTVQRRVRSVVDARDLAGLAAELAEARHDVVTALPDAVHLASLVGTVSIEDLGGVERGLDAFASVLREAAEANLAVIGTRRRDASDRLDPATLEAARVIADGDLRGSDTPIGRLADAVTAFVATTSLITLQLSAASADDGVRRLSLVDPEAHAEQVAIAVAIGGRQYRVVSDAGADPTYVRYSTQWGATLAVADGDGVTDDLRVEGLEALWIANVLGQVTIALVGAG